MMVSTERFSDFEWDLEDETPVEARQCEREGCAEAGEHRAPKSRGALNDYYWFCLEHVREYNATWDFFDGMDESEIENFRERDMTWHRPTWRLGSNSATTADRNEHDVPLVAAVVELLVELCSVTDACFGLRE